MCVTLNVEICMVHHTWFFITLLLLSLESGTQFTLFSLSLLSIGLFFFSFSPHSGSNCETQTVLVPFWRWFLFLGLYLGSLC